MEMELIGNVNLSNPKDYQSIYASQLYGTFFAVYGKFTVEDTDPSDGIYKLLNLRLKILNYKGIINLGIIQAILRPVKDEEDKTLGWRLILELQALGGRTDCDVQCGSYEFTKGKSFISVDRRLKKLASIGGHVFDAEFGYREGFTTEVSGNNLVCTQEVKEKKPIPMEISDEDQQGQEVLEPVSDSGSQCPKSKLFVM